MLYNNYTPFVNILNPISEASSILAYPNPTTGLVHVEFSETDILRGSLQLYSSLGQLLKTYTLDGLQAEYSLDLSNYPESTYFLFLKDENGRLKGHQKLIKINR